MSLRNKAEDYFSKMNCVAARMCADMNETKASYEELWSSFTPEEQEQILTESIIKPEAIVKYGPRAPESRNEEYAVKLIIDDNCSYRDEHSAPFSFKTKSQRDLTVFKSDEVAVRKTRPKPPAPKKHTQKTAAEELPALDESSASAQFIPKTGLDLLDNW